jgi:hypothetical protein
MRKCRRCGVGKLKIVSDIIANRAVVHCQNRRCDVLYEEEFPVNAPLKRDPERKGNPRSAAGTGKVPRRER